MRGRSAAIESFRQLRKTLTFGALRVGQELAQRGEGATVEGMRKGLIAFGRAALPLRARLRRNMKLAGVYRKGLVDEHFERAADHLAMMAHLFRAGASAAGCADRFVFDASIGHLEQACANGKGVVTIAPHLVGFPVYGPVVSPRVPCAVYLRRNRDPRKMRINEAIGQAAGSQLVAPPPGTPKSERLKVAIDVLRQGRQLYITPDTPRKPAEGVPVTILGRQTHFPLGVFVMSMRTGAPVVPVWWHWDGRKYRIRYDEPIELARGRGMRKKAASAVQRWAGKIDAYLHEHPEMWWNWLDKRWTRIIRDGM